MAEFFDCAEAAKAAKCSIFTIREAIKNGELKAFKPARGYLIDPADLDSWVRSRAVKARKKIEKKGDSKNP